MEFNIDGIELMGDNVRDKLNYCGNGVFLYPMCKIIHPNNLNLDDHCRIFDFAFIDAGKCTKIGKYTTITWHCLIEGGAKACIGDRVFLGPGSKILTSTYEINGYYSVEKLPGDSRATSYGDITIENDAYIGAGSIVMPGVTIGEGAVVGANSLVNRNLKPWGIYFGNPVKLVGERDKPTAERMAIIDQMDWTKHF